MSDINDLVNIIKDYNSQIFAGRCVCYEVMIHTLPSKNDQHIEYYITDGEGGSWKTFNFSSESIDECIDAIKKHFKLVIETIYDEVLNRYIDLKHQTDDAQFRLDRYSKDIDELRSKL